MAIPEQSDGSSSKIAMIRQLVPSRYPHGLARPRTEFTAPVRGRTRTSRARIRVSVSC